MNADAVPLRLQIGARTLWSIRRRLVRVPLSLAEAERGRAPVLPPLGAGDHGWLVTSLPDGAVPVLAGPERLLLVRQRYTRWYVDLSLGRAAWWADLSSGARSTLGRKARRLAAASGGELAIMRARDPDAVAAMLPDIRAIAATTYQARLLGTELPPDAELLALAAADALRGWVLRIDGRPAAFLLCGAQGDALRYEHCGHDPATADWSPGAVLQVEALGDLLVERRFARFDFLEGEGQHKRQMASGGVACADVLILRRSVTNRAALAALAGFDAAVAWAKRAKRLRRMGRSIGR